MKPILPLDELARVSVMEEASEVSIELIKGKRFGFDTPNPYDGGSTPNQRLSRELGDLLGSIRFLIKHHPGIDLALVEEHMESREPRLLEANDADKVWPVVPQPGRDYGVLRVALRNAIFRAGESDTTLCPSSIFRRIESGDLDVGTATDLLADVLSDLGEKRWLDGVESTALSFSA